MIDLDEVQILWLLAGDITPDDNMREFCAATEIGEQLYAQMLGWA